MRHLQLIAPAPLPGRPVVKKRLRNLWRICVGASALTILLVARTSLAQGSAALGDGLSAAAIGRGGTTVVQQSNPSDAVQGNPAGLAQLKANTLDLDGVVILGSGNFRNAYNPNARMSGLAGALPYGAFALRLRRSPWVFATAITPEILMKAKWKYYDAPGTASVSYGLQDQETQIIGIRSSVAAARPLGSRWNVGTSLGVVYNQNHLEAPYIFQQQPALKGLKTLVDLTTRGYGWNGSAGIQWQPTHALRAGLAWKSGTTIHTHGDLTGSASALFNALGVAAPADFTYKAQVMNHLPQAFAGGISLQTSPHVTLVAEGGMIAWGQAFQQLPITLTDGSNAVINSVAGSSTLVDAVPLHWKNQAVFHGGVEYPVKEAVTLRGGYSFRTNPVPSGTLTPLTAAIMQQSLATGGGWTRGRWHSDLAYQIQLPGSESVGKSSLQAGEYNDSTVRILIQSVTLSVRRTF